MRNYKLFRMNPTSKGTFKHEIAEKVLQILSCEKVLPDESFIFCIFELFLLKTNSRSQLWNRLPSRMEFSVIRFCFIIKFKAAAPICLGPYFHLRVQTTIGLL